MKTIGSTAWFGLDPGADPTTSARIPHSSTTRTVLVSDLVALGRTAYAGKSNRALKAHQPKQQHPQHPPLHFPQARLMTRRKWTCARYGGARHTDPSGPSPSVLFWSKVCARAQNSTPCRTTPEDDRPTSHRNNTYSLGPILHYISNHLLLFRLKHISHHIPQL